MGNNSKKALLHRDLGGAAYAGGEYIRVNTNTAASGVNADSSPSYLHRINVNIAGTSWNVVIYDGTSTSGAVVANLDASTKGSYEFGAHLSNGLTYVTSGTTPGDVTIIYSSANNA